MKNKLLSGFLALVMMLSVLPANMMTAHAQETKDYTVTFAPGALCLFNGEGDYETRTYDGSGEFLLPEPADVNLVGRMDYFPFAGWVVEGTSEPVYPAGQDVAALITGDMTFLANFEEPLAPGTVSYTIDPGDITNDITNRVQSIGPIPEEYVNDISLPATNEMLESVYGWIIPAGYTFARWEDKEGRTFPMEGDFTVPFFPENGQTYTAIWFKEDVETFTVTLNPGSINGTPVEAQPVYGGPFVKDSAYYGPGVNPFPAQTINEETYRAVGWSYTEGGEAIIFDEPILMTEDLTLYAVWEKDEIRDSYIVTLYPGEGASFHSGITGYDYNNGTLVYLRTMNEDGNALVYLPGEDMFATMPEGKIFGGWLDNATGEIYPSNEVITITADTTFTAVWVDATNA